MSSKGSQLPSWRWTTYAGSHISQVPGPVKMAGIGLKTFRFLTCPNDIKHNPTGKPFQDYHHCSDWVNDHADHLDNTMVVIMERMEGSKKYIKKNHDAGTCPRVFALGSMVLIRTPYMRGKQGDIWEGQSEVIRVISVVTIEIPLPRQTK